MGTKNAKTTSTQTLPGYINDAYKQLIEQAQQTGQTGYTPYEGGFTPDQQAAFQNIASLWGASDPAFSAASSAYGTAMVPTSQTVGQYMSPYTQSVVDAAMANMQEQNAQQQQQVVGNAIAKGAMGGNRVGVAQAELGRQQKLADNAAIANILQSGYGTALGAAQADKQAALGAAGGLAGLGQAQMQTGLAQAASQLGAGTQQQQFDYQQYLNQLAFPYQQQSWLASIIGGLGSTAGGTTTQQTPQGNMFSQLLGAGLGIAGLFSDERVKEDARPVGKTFDGQTIYSYRYKGQPQTHIGLMAQEVAKRHPEAVGQRSGVLTVDYDRATDKAAHRGKFASGGGVSAVPYVHEGDFGSFMSRSTGMPFGNDGDFTGYVPIATNIGGGGNRIPEAAKMPEQQDPFADPTGMLKKGAGNISSWLSPSIAEGAAIPDGGFIPGITGPMLFNRGGVVGDYRPRAQAGGRMTPDEIAQIYGGIILPEGGLVGGAPLPPPARRVPDVPIIDTVNALDGDRLGLGVDTTPSRTLPPRGEDPYIAIGGNDSPYPPLEERPFRTIPGGNRPGEVIYGRGERFRTDFPEEGFSRNGTEAIQSLFAGRGLNLAPDAQNALLNAGFGMMASKSPFFLQGVGEGGLAGMKAWQDYQTMERENALARSGIGQKGEELALKAEELGAQVPYYQSQTLSTDVATQRERFDYRYTPFGVQITDKISGLPGAIFPYYSMLPDGTIALPEEGGAAARPMFSTDAPIGPPDARLFTDQGAGQVLGQADVVLKTTQAEAAAAQSTQQMLEEMKHNLSTLPGEGIMAPGTDFKQRADLAKGINSYLGVFGLNPAFPEGEIAAAEDLNKLTNRLGFDLSRMLGTNEAASIVMTGIESVPGGLNSRAGAERIIAGLEAGNRRRIDLYTFLQNWAAKNGGSILGAEEYFNRANPPELYGLSSYVPQEAMELLRRDPSPEAIAEFNDLFGSGRNVARFVIGG